MSKDKRKALSIQEGHIVVKNRKFKKSDIAVFCVCIVLSLIIWIYATNVEKKEAQALENIVGEVQTVQKAQLS